MLQRPILVAGAASGLVSVALFTAMDVIGAVLRPGYSSISQAVSELIEVGAPNKPVLDAMLVGYHGLVIPFAITLHYAVNRGTGSRVGPVLLALAGGLGVVLTLFFPCDVGCEPFVSVRGTAHIFIAIPMGFAILFAILAFSMRFARQPDWVRYVLYSRLTFAAGVALAGVTVLLAESEVVGLLERLLTASYLQWYVVMAIVVIRRNLRRAPGIVYDS